MKPRYVLVCFFVVLLCVRAERVPKVTTSQGTLIGSYLKSQRGDSIAAFMSIPYAEPPLGELRFKPPVEAKSWEGEKNVSEVAPQCIQNNPYVRIREISGSEDCLFLSLYAPEETISTSRDLLPVMVFFHGGGWMCGTGGLNFYGPEYIVDKSVIYIGVNYRLSVFGLFSTMDDAAPGNWALKDQNLALRWVQKNVIHFGGDPDCVTIFGESAGAASVHYHMMSPKSRGLFHRAIMQSGTALCPWANSPPNRTEDHAKLLGKVMSCPTYDSKKLVDCLRKKSAKQLIDADKYFYDWDFDPMIPFRPVVEPKHEDSFLDEDPRVTMLEGRIARVPVLIGHNRNEGALRSSGVFGIPGQLEELSEHFDKLAPITFDYGSSKYADDITKAIKQFYFDGKDKPKLESKQALTDIYSDSLFIAGIDETLGLLSIYNPEIFYYHFTYKGNSSYSQIFGDPKGDYGACHVDEMTYILKTKLFPELNEQGLEVQDYMTTIWSTFAKTGKPDLTWLPFDRNKFNHRELGGDYREVDGLADDRRAFWRELPLWQKEHSKIYKNGLGTSHILDHSEL